MTHCYIFNYADAELYHTIIPEGVEDVDSYVAKKLNTRVSNIYTLCCDEPLEIKELEEF